MTACKVPDLECKSHHNKDLMTSIISLADMADDYRINMDNKCDKAMHAHMDSKVARLGQTHDRLHGLDLQHDNVCAPE